MLLMLQNMATVLHGIISSSGNICERYSGHGEVPARFLYILPHNLSLSFHAVSRLLPCDSTAVWTSVCHFFDKGVALGQ